MHTFKKSASHYGTCGSWEELSFRHYLQHNSGTTQELHNSFVPVGKSAVVKFKSYTLLEKKNGASLVPFMELFMVLKEPLTVLKAL